MRVRVRSFRGRVLGGYVLAILPLVLAMGVTVANIDRNSALELERLRSEQNESALVERLRWSADLLSLAGRGYLIAGAPALLNKVRRYEAEFDAAVHQLEQQQLSPTGAALVEEVEHAAVRFRSAQARLLSDRSSSDLVERFETELQPLGAQLSSALSQLAQHEKRSLDAAFDQTRHARRDLVLWTFALLGTFTAVGLGLAHYFAHRLARAYRKQQQAVASSEEAVRQRDELMGIVAHDLRNPLNSIALKAAVLRHGLFGNELSRHAESIGTIAAGMADLVASILDLSTVESGHLSLEARPLKITELLDQVTDIHQGLARVKGIRWERVCDEPDLQVLGDPKRVLQVFSNLLGNAIKVTPRAGVVGIGAERDGATARFSVWDTGPGIREEHRPHIFERRWTYASGGKHGTGLGLFIAKTIIDAHGGRIWLEPAERGTIFRFTLPLCRSARESHQLTSGEAPRSRGGPSRSAQASS